MRQFVLLAGVALAALACGSTRAEVLIGAAGPITGPLAWIGEQMQRATELAVADLNQAGGVLGEQVRLIAADDYCDPAQAVAAARKLVGEGAIFVSGHYCSGASISAAAVYEAAGVLQISPASTNPSLTDQGRANVFRVIGRDDAQGSVAGDYLADNWAGEKIAIFHDGAAYGKGLADETRKRIHGRGVTEAIYETYAAGQNDYSAEIAALAEADIAVLYVGGYHTEVALMARAARDRGYPLQIVSGDTISTEEFSLIAGPAAEGTLFTFSADARQSVEAAPVVERFRAENYEPAGYTLFTYAAVQVWAQAVESAGSFDLEAVIPSMRSQTFDTVLGKIAFDEKGDLEEQSWVWYVWKGIEYVPVE